MNDILSELQSDVYGISSAVLQRINEYLEKCDIRFVSFVKKTEPVAKIVENVQTGSEDNLIVRPCLYILQEDCRLNLDAILYHEIMHLFSMDYCIPIDPPHLFSYRNGLELYNIYDLKQIVRVNNCALLNELLNDSIASFLYATITNNDYHSNEQFSFLQFHKYLISQLTLKSYSKEQLIGAYFSHNDKVLKEILLNDSYQNFCALDQKLNECYVEYCKFFSETTFERRKC